MQKACENLYFHYISESAGIDNIKLMPFIVANNNDSDDLAKHLQEYAYIISEARYYGLIHDRYYSAKDIAFNSSIVARRKVSETEIENYCISGIVKSYRDFTFGYEKEWYLNTYNPAKILKPSEDIEDINDIIWLFESVTDTNTEDMAYLMKYITWKYLHPLSPNAPAIILHGNQWTWKTSFARLLQTIFSKEYSNITLTQRELEEKFDAITWWTLVCCVNEVTTWSKVNDIRISNRLKNLILAEEIWVRRLYKDRNESPNHNIFVITSNSDRPLHFDSTEVWNRRFSVFKSTRRLSENSFKAVADKNKVAQFLKYILSAFGEEVKNLDMFPDWNNKAKRILERGSCDTYEDFWDYLEETRLWEFIKNEEIKELFSRFVVNADEYDKLSAWLINACRWDEERPRINWGQPRWRFIG